MAINEGLVGLTLTMRYMQKLILKSMGKYHLEGSLPENSEYVHVTFKIIMKMKTQNFKSLINNLLNSENISDNCNFRNTGLKESMSESAAVFTLIC